MTRIYRRTPYGVIHQAFDSCTEEHCEPVLVIGADDTELIMRLAAEQVAARREINAPVDAMAAAVRALLDPKPAIEEPAGLGAVVRDAHGALWVRAGNSFTDPNWRRAGGDEWHRFADIGVPDEEHILSRGVGEGGAS